MENTRYAVWFLTTVALALLALMGFNALAGAYILNHPAGGSTQTLSGFERALKPVWLKQIQPQLVFAGSSRVRDGFDPVLIDPALKNPRTLFRPSGPSLLKRGESGPTLASLIVSAPQ